MGVRVTSSGLPLGMVGVNRPGLWAGVLPTVLAPDGRGKSRDGLDEMEEKDEF